ncbi:MAG: hypothetical protein ACQEXV_22375 [Bacillota bacterium]
MGGERDETRILIILENSLPATMNVNHLVVKFSIGGQAMMSNAKTIGEQINKLEELFTHLMERGMDGHAGLVWPVFIRNWGKGNGSSKYMYHYPSSYFYNLKVKYNILTFIETKQDRLAFLKWLTDKLITNAIDIHLYHFAQYLLYARSNDYQMKQDIEAMGKRRAAYMEKLPRFELESTDDFISSVWSELIERLDSRHWNTHSIYNPSMSEVRILFTPKRFGDYTGTYYNDADWIEPESGARDLKVKKWTREKDPMNPEAAQVGMIEGQIIQGHEGASNRLRHFVNGKPVNAGSYIEVKFGDGWIPGRYEWNFEKNGEIQIYSTRSDWFVIHEGSLVRIRA